MGNIPDEEFTRLYQELWPQVYQFVYYKVQNKQEAEEITQEVFQKVYKQVQKNKVKDSKLKAYTLTAARNAIYDKWRRKGRRPNVIALEGLQEKGFDIEAKEKRIDENLIVQEALNLLPAESREIITLRIIEGYSISDVAEKTGKPEGTIKAIQFRALQKLRSILKEGGFFDD